MPCDVLQKDEGGTYLLHHSVNLGPQVARIVFATLETGLAERLARVARSDAIHDATPRCAVEGLEIRPYRSRSHAAFFHLRDQLADGESVPFNEAHDASRSDRQLEAEVEPAASGTEGEDTESGITHTSPPPYPRRTASRRSSRWRSPG